MAIEWMKAKAEMVTLVEDLIAEHHPHLRNYRIGVVAWEGNRNAGQKRILGKAGKVTPKMLPLLSEELDALVELSADYWVNEASLKQKRALVDHELCHLRYDPERGLYVIGHDIEEFNVIIQRYGFWREDVKHTAQAIQYRLQLGDKAPIGGVFAPQIG